MNDAPIPSWPLNLAKLNDRLAGREIALPGGETGFILRPDLAGLEFPAPPPEFPAAGIEIFLETNGENWELRFWGRAAEEALRPPEGLAAEDIPAELKPALLALALEPHLDRAAPAWGHRARLVLAPPAEELDQDATRYFRLPFTLTDAAGRPAGGGQARIPLSPAALAALADLAKAFPRRAAAPRWPGLPVFLSLLAAQETFPIKILREAGPGDVLLFAGPPALTLAVHGRPLWTAALADGQITLQGVLNKNPEEAAMSAAPENPGRPAAGGAPPENQGLSPAEMDALEITLSLELDEIRLTLGELAALGPGRMLATAASLEGPVAIKTGGRTIGRGRLVEAGGRLGVLIVSLGLREEG